MNSSTKFCSRQSAIPLTALLTVLCFVRCQMSYQPLIVRFDLLGSTTLGLSIRLGIQFLHSRTYINSMFRHTIAFRDVRINASERHTIILTIMSTPGLGYCGCGTLWGSSLSHLDTTKQLTSAVGTHIAQQISLFAPNHLPFLHLTLCT